MPSPTPDAANVRLAARNVVSEMLGQPVKDDELLISSGRIDSLSILRLISLLEIRLGLKIPQDTLQPDDFDCVDCIVETVERVAIPR